MKERVTGQPEEGGQRANRPLLLDGGSGVWLRKQGFDAEKPPCLAVIEAPDLVRRMYGEWLAAGVDGLHVNTFGATRIGLEDGRSGGKGSDERSGEVGGNGSSGGNGSDERSGEVGGRGGDNESGVAERVNREAVRIARALLPRDRKVLLIGDVSLPWLKSREVMTDSVRVQLVSDAAEQIGWLVDERCDVLHIETAFSAELLRVVLEGAAMARCDVPIWVSFALNQTGQAVGGDSLDALLDCCHQSAFDHLSITRLGLNCSLDGIGVLDLWERVKSRDTRFSIVQPGGCGDPNRDAVSWSYFVDNVSAPKRAGEFFAVGGCCEVTPEQIAHLAKSIAHR